MEIFTTYIIPLILGGGVIIYTNYFASQFQKNSLNNQNKIDSLIVENKSISESILDLNSEIKNLAQKIDKTTEQNNDIAKNNKSLLDENKIITKELKNLATEINDISKKIENNTDAIVFYNKTDYNFLHKIFTNGYFIIRQNLESDKPDFIKTYGNIPYYATIDSEIITKDNKFKYVNDFYNDQRRHTSKGNIITNEISLKTSQLQIFKHIHFRDGYSSIYIIKSTQKEIIYAFGKITKEQEKSLNQN